MKLTKIVSKKILIIVSLLFAFVFVVGCEKEKNTAPTLTGVSNTSTPYGVAFDPLSGVTAYDKEDGDLTSKIEVSGTVNVNTAADYTLNYTVKDSEGLEAKATRIVTVNELTEATLANGWYNYKFATSDVKTTFFSAAEKWLLENGYAGIPLAAQSGMTLQHKRITLPVENYVPSFGWGTSYASLSMDDAQVAAENSNGQLDLINTPAVAGKYTYRSWNSSEPETLNYYTGKSNTESDYGSYINGSFYSAVLNDTANGWKFTPVLADGEPVPTNPEVINGKTISKTWTINLKDNLKWAYNTGTDTSNFPKGHDILDATDYEYTYRLALDNEWFRATQGGGDFVSLKVKGAEEYVAAVARKASQDELDELWEKFGIHASEDGKSLTVQFKEPVSLFNFKYQFGMPAINQAVYESDPELYGTDPQHVASSGMYKITYWETGVGSRYEKVDTYPLSSKVQWTGESISILTGTSSQETAFQSFLSGLLDAVGVPQSRVKDYKEDPKVLKSPGATVWSLNINMVGSTQAQQAQWPGSTYVPEPILGNKDFRLALYFSLDRDQMVQYDPKTYPTSMKISEAYYVDPEEGIPYRSTEQGISVGENLAYSTNGYDPEAAQALFKRAVAAEIAKGNYQKGTAENYTIIDLEVLTFDASSGSAVADNWINFAKHYFELLVDDENYVKVQLTSKKIPGSQIYDEIDLGNYELALSSISGNVLDASSFLDIFCSDNRSGFLLNYGYDSSVPEIEVKWEDNGIQHFETFSFDAIYELLNGKVYIKDGKVISEYSSVDSIIEVFLGENEYTEVSRSAENGDLLLPVVVGDFENDADEVISLLVNLKNEDGEEKSYLFVMTRTGSIYELYKTVEVSYELSEDAVLDKIVASLTGTEKSTVSEEDLASLDEYFGFELDKYDSVTAYYYTLGDSRTLVIVGKVGDLYLVVANEKLKIPTQDNINSMAASAVTQYGLSAFNIREVADDDLFTNGYLTTTYKATTKTELASALEAPEDFLKYYQFDIDTAGNQREKGDIFIVVVIVAGNLVGASWL